jgi:N4-gp56 family major capsid protein
MNDIQLINNTGVYRNPAPTSPLQGQNVMQPAAVYSKIMLRTIELAESDFEFAKLAVKRSMPSNNGSNEIVFKRMLSLAAHTQPLVEGIPPASDQGRMVAIKAATKQYGRYMEFTDKVDWAVVDPLISEYTRQLSLKVPETKDLIAQQALLAECQLFYAAEKEVSSIDGFLKPKAGGDVTHIKYLTPNSSPTIDEFRKIVLTMEAAKVRPMMGKNFLALVSSAVYFDLITDKRVQEFMKYQQTGQPYMDDTVVDLFNLAFRKAKTIKTDNSFIDANGATKFLYHVTGFTGTVNSIAYSDKPANVIAAKKWDEVAGGDNIIVQPLVKTGGLFPAETTLTKTAFLAMITAANGTIDVLNVHYSYVLGEEALFEISVEGHGAPQFISKPLGSAGVADPLNQRQSIGWKLDSIGFKVANPDAVQAYLSVPTQYRITIHNRPDLKNEFTEYDYGYVDAAGNFYWPEQVVQSLFWNGTANVIKYLVKGTTTEVTAQKLTKLVKPVVPGRIDANGKNQVIVGDLPTKAFALASNKLVRFLEDQVVLHTDGKFYIKGLAGTGTAEVVELPVVITGQQIVKGDGSGTETRTVLVDKIED